MAASTSVSENFIKNFCGTTIDFQQSRLNTSLEVIDVNKGLDFSSLGSFVVSALVNVEEKLDVGCEVGLPVVCREVERLFAHTQAQEGNKYFENHPEQLKQATTNLLNLHRHVMSLEDARVQKRALEILDPVISALPPIAVAKAPAEKVRSRSSSKLAAAPAAPSTQQPSRTKTKSSHVEPYASSFMNANHPPHKMGGTAPVVAARAPSEGRASSSSVVAPVPVAEASRSTTMHAEAVHVVAPSTNESVNAETKVENARNLKNVLTMLKGMTDDLIQIQYQLSRSQAEAYFRRLYPV